jgi:hypothetical protein
MVDQQFARRQAAQQSPRTKPSHWDTFFNGMPLTTSAAEWWNEQIERCPIQDERQWNGLYYDKWREKALIAAKKLALSKAENKRLRGFYCNTHNVTGNSDPCPCGRRVSLEDCMICGRLNRSLQLSWENVRARPNLMNSISAQLTSEQEYELSKRTMILTQYLFMVGDDGNGGIVPSEFPLPSLQEITGGHRMPGIPVVFQGETSCMFGQGPPPEDKV